jgi:hypothetical protein
MTGTAGIAASQSGVAFGRGMRFTPVREAAAPRA